MAPPNCCKRLPKRRLFARRPVGRLEQSALAGGTPPAVRIYKIGKRRAAVSVVVFSRFAIYANVVRRTLCAQQEEGQIESCAHQFDRESNVEIVARHVPRSARFQDHTPATAGCSPRTRQRLCARSCSWQFPSRFRNRLCRHGYAWIEASYAILPEWRKRSQQQRSWRRVSAAYSIASASSFTSLIYLTSCRASQHSALWYFSTCARTSPPHFRSQTGLVLSRS